MSRIESVKEGPSISFGLSLAGGVLILAGAVISWTWHSLFFSQMGWMMGAPAFAPVMSGVSIIGIVSGAMVILGSVMMYMKPHESKNWAILVLIFSAVSLFGMGGFLLGAVLGIIGGILALSKH